MKEVMRWKLKGFIPGVEGVSKALFQPWVVPAVEFDRLNAERNTLQQRLTFADELVREAWRLMDGQDPKTTDWHMAASKHINTSTRPAIQLQGEPAMLPESYCIMPRQLTAENGAKALLLGEFKLSVTMQCLECSETDEPSEGCEICDGEGEYAQKRTIPWDQIKFIYSKAVAGLSRSKDTK